MDKPMLAHALPTRTSQSPIASFPSQALELHPPDVAAEHQPANESLRWHSHSVAPEKQQSERECQSWLQQRIRERFLTHSFCQLTCCELHV